MPDYSKEDFAAEYGVSRETLGRLTTYAALLEKWNQAINLVAKSTVSDLWSRHFRDSAQIMQHVTVPKGHWIDLGSGGGFPAIVCAIMGEGAYHVTCVESDVRKSTFLQTVARETEAPVKVLNQRAEDLSSQIADVITARAFTGLTDLLGYAHVLRPGGQALFLKGASHQEEIKAALATWRFTVQTHQSVTQSDAAVLSINEISRA